MAEDKIIPNLEIDAKNRIIEQIKEIPLLINGEEVKIKIKKLNTGIRNRIKSECSKTTFVAGQPKVEVNEQEIQEKILSEAIIEAPFETGVKDIKLLPSEVTDYLFIEYTDFAEPVEKKNSK